MQRCRHLGDGVKGGLASIEQVFADEEVIDICKDDCSEKRLTLGWKGGSGDRRGPAEDKHRGPQVF